MPTSETETFASTRPASAVISDIQKYKNWYKVNGIFFDEMSNTPGEEYYYANLSSYAGSIGLLPSVGNVGTTVPNAYAGTMNVFVVSEGSGLAELSSITHSAPTGVDLGAIAFGIPSINQSYVSTISKSVRYLYFTDFTLPNPYGSLKLLHDVRGDVEL